MAAHVDAGKTTLAEALMYVSGSLRRLGRVDDGNACLDTHPIERSRGITVFSKQAVMRTGGRGGKGDRGGEVGRDAGSRGGECEEGSEYTLLDTPGHSDFSAETERAISVLDCAVLVISAVDGVQSHTSTLWELLRRADVPVFAFVNKTDLCGKSREEILSELQELSPDFVEYDGKFAEKCAEYDEDCMNSLIESGSVPDGLISAAIAKRNVFPVCFGSALKLEGIDTLIELLEKYSAPKERYGEFSAKVYKISLDDSGARLTCMKITGGTLSARTALDDSGEKITRLRVYNGAKYSAVETAHAGQLIAAEGLTKTYAGQVFGKQPAGAAPVTEPVLSCKVILPEGADVPTVMGQLKRLEEEDPQLNFSWNERLSEIHVTTMGEIQLEVLQNIALERFGLAISFGESSIAYRETIAGTVEGMGHYEPLRHYAEVHLFLEPLPRGSGVVFARDCANGLDEAYQRLIMSELKSRVHVGALTGSPITDIRITLKAGRAHVKHTEGGDFRQAAWRAVRQGLASAESVLLEPYCCFRLALPRECVGRAMTDLERMGAEFSLSEDRSGDDTAVIEGICPFSEIRGYPTEIAAYTRGEGRLSLASDGYYPCHNADEVIKRIGYDFDADTENSADSVFCSHGAGVLVKWDAAPVRMHIPPILVKREPITNEEISSYKQRAASDKELMEIFERTYGKIKRDTHTAMRRDKPREQNYKSSAPVKRGSVYLLVDGYNIIFSWDELSQIARTSLDAARQRLINMMCNYQGFKKCVLILVFDAYRVKSDREIENYGDVQVVYTKESETADTYIEKTSHTLSKENRVRVATSDGTEQMIILGNGAERVSASEFRLEVEAVEKKIREIIESLH